MNKQRKVVITITYNEMGIIIDTKAEEVAQPNLQPTCNQLATDTISRQAAIDAVCKYCEYYYNENVIQRIKEIPSAQPEKRTNERTETHACDLISRQAIINSFRYDDDGTAWDMNDIVYRLEQFPSAQPEPFVDADKLKSCRFEYINACKIVAHPTPDTSKNDIYDANAVIKALHPIFGDAEF